MRFAWIRTTGAPEHQPTPTTTARLVLFGYNLVWWIPVFATVIGLVSYRVGFLTFLAVTVVRAAVNVYRINIMSIDRAMDFPLRIP